MKMNFLFRLFLLVAALGLGPVVGRAQNEEAIKARMAQRLSAVDALKDRQVAGENNRGLLEPRGQVTGADQAIISEENSDRQAVYAALAAKTGASPDTVGRQRAQQIAIRSKRGVWIQDPSGEWRQKP